uniref:VWFD domain-containing protein n=1 Tax=Sphaeramia orbicularis TaxID=375764 RepID=A0A673C939_9TELE
MTTPFFLNNGTVQVYESGFSVTISTVFGLVVSYDANHYVQISVPYGYQNKTCGLCGDFNNHPEDDFRTRQGVVVSSDVVFANSWKAPGEDDDGCGTGCGGLGCASCTDAQTALYGNSDHCGILQNSSGPFAACHEELPPQNFMESCVFDLCFGRGYQPILCQALSAYASQCQQNGVQLPSWRRQGFCEIPCPANSHFESQGTGCPATCVNPNSTQNCPLPAQESCICNSGYILSGGNCVPHAQCGCSFEGNYYHSGETVILDQDCGRQCNCSYGSMRCRPNSFGTCWIRGPGSYQTFDGLTYQYPGACQLTLAKVMGMSSHPHFVVSAEKVPQAQQGFARVLKFEAQGTHVSIEMSTNSGIQIYHSSIHSIILRTSFGVTVQTVWPHFVRITAPVVYSSSIGGLCGNFNGHPHDDFRTPNGILVNSSQAFGDSWRDGNYSCSDGCGTSCPQCTNDQPARAQCEVITLWAFAACHEELPPQNFVESCVFDLCVGRGYQPILCQALSAYASQCQQNGVQLPSWRRQGFCEIPCPANSHFESQGTGCPATCVNPNSTQNCPLPAQESCICNSGYILSGGNCVPHAQCGCSFEGNYYHSGETVILDQDCGRRCNCSYGSMSCQPYGCGPLESCRLEEGERGCRPNSFGTCWIRGPGLSFPFSCNTPCQEGCQCDDGFVLNGNQCVPPTGCGCHHQGRYRQGGEQFWAGDECQSLCSCDEYGCHPSPHGTCSASGDPHYLTFDRNAYDFQGTCRYVLATLCNDTTGLHQFSVEARNEAWRGLPVSITAEVFVNVWV